jgi:hypothetical protein
MITLPVASQYGILFDLPSYVSLAATAAVVLLLPLYFSQRRDLQRLRAWMTRDPGHPAADLVGSEALLDRAETELEAVLGVEAAGAAVEEGGEAAPEAPPAAEVAPAHPTPATPVTPLPPAQRVSHERPALERITMERAALEPHPRWRRFAGRIGQTRVLAVVALVAVVLGLVGIFGSESLLRGTEQAKHGPKPGAIVPGDVEVAVLNATSVPGLAAKVGDDVRVNGFKLGTVSNSRRQFDQTVVMYEPHEKRAAEKVAHDLGVQPVQPIDQQAEQASGGADVVVIAGADRARL